MKYQLIIIFKKDIKLIKNILINYNTIYYPKCFKRRKQLELYQKKQCLIKQTN